MGEELEEGRRRGVVGVVWGSWSFFWKTEYASLRACKRRWLDSIVSWSVRMISINLSLGFWDTKGVSGVWCRCGVHGIRTVAVMLRGRRRSKRF